MVLDLRGRDIAYDAIAFEVGLSVYRVRKICKEAGAGSEGITLRRSVRNLRTAADQSLVDEILRMRREHKTVRQVEAELKAKGWARVPCKTTIHCLIKEHIGDEVPTGVDPSGDGAAHKGETGATEERHRGGVHDDLLGGSPGSTGTDMLPAPTFPKIQHPWVPGLQYALSRFQTGDSLVYGMNNAGVAAAGILNTKIPERIDASAIEHTRYPVSSPSPLPIPLSSASPLSSLYPLVPFHVLPMTDAGTQGAPVPLNSSEPTNRTPFSTAAAIQACPFPPLVPCAQSTQETQTYAPGPEFFADEFAGMPFGGLGAANEESADSRHVPDQVWT